MAKGKLLKWNDALEHITNQAIEAIESGSNWEMPWNAPNAFPKMLFRDNLSGINVLICAFSGHANQLWVNYRDIKRNGLKFKDGFQEPTVILRPVFVKNTVELDDGGTKEVSTLVGFSQHKIWNVSQVEGCDEYLPKPKDNIEQIEAAEAVLKNLPETLPRADFGGNRACYNPVRHAISMPESGYFESSAAFYHTYFHELAHSTGHESLLKRELASGWDKEKYSKEELVAEMTASLICAEIGLVDEKSERNTAAYLAGWLKPLKSDPKYLHSAFKSAIEAAKYILNRKEEE